MEQRTCNIIMACKGHCQLPGGKNEKPLTAIAAYMSHECACPQEIYKGGLLETVLREALFDYFSTADNPASDLRKLLEPSYVNERNLPDRIAVVFSLAPVMKDDKPVNGFTEELLAQSEVDLGERPGLATGVPDERPFGEGLCGGCTSFPGSPEDRCGTCVRNAHAERTEADRYVPAPGTLCGRCVHNAKKGGNGKDCLACSRFPYGDRKGRTDLHVARPETAGGR